MGGKVFVDTNVLLRATLAQFPLHQQANQLVRDQIKDDAELWISRQVIREYIAQVSRPQTFMPPMSVPQIESQVTGMRMLFKIADENEAVTDQLLNLLKSHPSGGKQIHDANIVATMLTYGIGTLLTANIADLKRFEDRITLIPLIV